MLVNMYADLHYYYSALKEIKIGNVLSVLTHLKILICLSFFRKINLKLQMNYFEWACSHVQARNSVHSLKIL